MRIAFAVHGYSPSIGGAQSYARGLAEALAALGHEVHVVAPAIADPEAFYELGHHRITPTRETIGGVEVHRVVLLSRWRRFPRRPVPTLARERQAFAERLREALEGIAPDAVIALPHLFPNVTAVAELHSESQWRFAHAPMLHEDDPNWSIESVARVVSEADLAIALTDHERDRLVSSYQADTVAVVPPGIATHEDCTGDAAGPIALFVGRPAPGKRLEVLDEAMAMVQAEMPDAELVLAGSGVGALPPGRHRVVDTPTDTERTRLVESARLVVNASVVESFGLTTLEAWAHRTPVVVADTPVNRSIVRDGIDGLITGTDARSLAAGIRTLLEDPALASRLGDAGHRRACDEFSWERSARSLVTALG